MDVTDVCTTDPEFIVLELPYFFKAKGELDVDDDAEDDIAFVEIGDKDDDVCLEMDGFDCRGVVYGSKSSSSLNRMLVSILLVPVKCSKRFSWILNTGGSLFMDSCLVAS